MSAWTIFPICVGTIKQVEKSNYTYGLNQGIKIDGCSLIYVLKGGSEPIIIDTGMSEPGWASQHHYPSSRERSQEPLIALQKMGISCDDIRTVILTHLHWDHCFNNHLFPKARFLVQKDEIQYALFPLPIHALYYEAPSLGMTPHG
jgi:N-acyl homoserine lactone hydrolase